MLWFFGATCGALGTLLGYLILHLFVTVGVPPPSLALSFVTLQSLWLALFLLFKVLPLQQAEAPGWPPAVTHRDYGACASTMQPEL